MSARFARNAIAVLLVILIWGLMLAMGGCSMISMEKGAKNSATYEKITFRGPPKDFKALDFKFGEGTRLKAGEAATAEQPWADVAGDWGELLLNISAYCAANPGWAMCADN